MTKTLIATAISAVLAAPLGALADDDATLWPDKAKPVAGRTEQQKQRGTNRADEATSGNSAAASGSTRPSYDPPLRPSDARPVAGPSQPSAEGRKAKPKGE